MAAMVMSACGTAPSATTAINIPAVSVGQSTQTVEGYPVEGSAITYPAGSTAGGASSAYPAGTSTTMTDAQIEALLTEKLGGHHTLDWVLTFDKTYEEWDQFLSNHHGVTFTPEEKDQVIKYLMSH